MPVRLILHTDSIKQSDVHTFDAAARTLESEYRRLYVKDKDSVKRMLVKSGQEIVHAINAQATNAIVSLDVVSHGNQSGVHIARVLPKPVQAGIFQRHSHYLWRLTSDRPQAQSDAEYCEESIHGLYTDWSALQGVAIYYNQVDGGRADVAYLSDIDYSRFKEGAHLEFHGCLTAEMFPVFNHLLKDNFAKQLSDNLPRGCTVVGHINRSNPNRVPSSLISDYRHGAVRVYRDGRLIESGDRAVMKFPNSSTPQ